jgi:hypothetical protein
MAKIRYAVIANGATETATSTTGTITKDLPERGILTELYPQVTYTKVYSTKRPLPDWEAVTKIEVLVDGSTVVKSLSGPEIRALTYYNGGPFATTALFHGTGGDTDGYSGLPLYLNRYAGDNKAGLDLAAYSNPQIKITYDTSQTTIDGVTYEAATSPTIKYNIMAKIIDGTPNGFMNCYVQSRQIDTWTQTASAEHSTEIPRGFDLYRLMYKSGYLDTGWTHYMDKVKLDFDNGVWKPLDLDHEDIAMLQKAWYPSPVTAGWWDKAASADKVNFMVHQLAGAGAMTAANTGHFVYYDMHETGLHDTLIYTDAGAAQTSAVNNHIFVQGWGPMQSIAIPMKELVDGTAEVVPTTDYGRIDLKITTGASASTSAKAYVVAEYLKPNGR